MTSSVLQTGAADVARHPGARGGRQSVARSAPATLLSGIQTVLRALDCGCGVIGTISVSVTPEVYQGSRTLHILTMGGRQSQLTPIASVAGIEDNRLGHPIFARHPDVISTDVGGAGMRWANAPPNSVETSQSNRQAVAGRTAQAGRVTA